MRFNKLIMFLVLLVHFSSAAAIFSKVPEDCEKIIKKGVEAIQQEDYQLALEYFTEAKLMAEKNGWQEQLFVVHHNTGLLYYELLDYPEAMRQYQIAYEIATQHLDDTKEMRILNNIAILYAFDKDYEKAEKYFTRAYEIAKKYKDHTRIAHYAINLAWLANKTVNLEVGMTYLDEAFELLKNEKETILYQQARLNLAENYLLAEEHEKSRVILEELLLNPELKKYKKDYIEVQYFLASIYPNQGRIDKALQFAHQALQNNDSYESRIWLFNKLAEIHSLEGNHVKAVEYKDSIISNMEQWEKLKQEKLYENSKMKFELQDYINELKNNQEKLEAERKFFGFILVMTLVLCFLIYRFFRIRLTKLKQKRTIAEREKEITALELENEKKEHLLLEKQLKEIETQAKLEQELLTNEIEQKNRTLSAKALYLSGRNELIEEVVNSLSKIPEVAENKILKDHIKTLTRHVKTDNEWGSFFTHFEEVNPGLLNALKQRHPKLTSNDIRFLCYVYMNLSTKEICLIFNITPEACRKRKERIAKKMDLLDSSSLYSYISNIDHTDQESV